MRTKIRPRPGRPVLGCGLDNPVLTASTFRVRTLPRRPERRLGLVEATGHPAVRAVRRRPQSGYYQPSNQRAPASLWEGSAGALRVPSLEARAAGQQCDKNVRNTMNASDCCAECRLGLVEAGSKPLQCVSPPSDGGRSPVSTVLRAGFGPDTIQAQTGEWPTIGCLVCDWCLCFQSNAIARRVGGKRSCAAPSRTHPQGSH